MAMAAPAASAQPCCLPPHFNGVKALLEEAPPFHHLPSPYIQPHHHRPSASPVCHGIQLPIIDITELQGDGRSHIVQQIAQACKDWGFFQVVGHGVSPDVMDKMYDVTLQFFSLPTEEKMRHFSTDVRSHMRYGTSFNVREDKILNWRDFLRFSCFPLEQMMPLWPTEPAEFRNITAEFATQLRRLIERLLQAISESLGLKADYIEKAFGSPSQIIGLNYYPECPAPDLTLGIPPHSDPGGITVLMQDQVGGLQIRHNDCWIAVRPIPHAFVVNIGDQIQILSNGKYQSVEHRAIVNSDRFRISIVNANGPSFQRVIAPAPELVDENHPPIYRESLYEDFMVNLQSKPLDRRSVLDTLRIL